MLNSRPDTDPFLLLDESKLVLLASSKNSNKGNRYERNKGKKEGQEGVGLLQGLSEVFKLILLISQMSTCCNSKGSARLFDVISKPPCSDAHK